MAQYNVLVFPGGTEVGLEILKSLRYCKEIVLFSAASGMKNHAEYVYEHHREIPSVFEDDCLFVLNSLIKEWSIEFIFPANPLVIDFLNKHRSEIDCALIMNSESVLEITRSKSATYQELNGFIPVPKLFHVVNEESLFPVFVKPDSMYGAQDVRKIDNFDAYVACPPKSGEIVTEYLPGNEFTIDCFTNRHGKVLFAGPRSRERIRMGTSMHSETPDGKTVQLLQGYAQIIQSLIPLRGAWFFQVKLDAGGQYKLLEVEARIAGTMALHRVQGVNFPLLSVFDVLSKDVNITSQPGSTVIDRALTNRYSHSFSYSTIYVDLDDTLLVKGKINIQLIQFLYQCINNGNKIILISKSLSSDPMGLLRHWKISELFDEIYWLREEESKADYITGSNAIFIDDSFSQRMEVNARHGIPTFDPSMIEILLDERGK